MTEALKGGGIPASPAEGKGASDLIKAVERHIIPICLTLRFVLASLVLITPYPIFPPEDLSNIWMRQVELVFPVLGGMIVMSAIFYLLFRSKEMDMMGCKVAFFVNCSLFISYIVYRSKLFPTVVDPLTGRPFFAWREADWSSHVPLLMYQVGRLFRVPFEEMLFPMILESTYCQVSLWSKTAAHPLLRHGGHAYCWAAYLLSVRWMLGFRKWLPRQENETDLAKNLVTFKHINLYVLLASNGIYGIVYFLAMFDAIPVDFEMGFWCCGDVVTKGFLMVFVAAIEIIERITADAEAKEQMKSTMLELESAKAAALHVDEAKSKFLRFIFHEVRVPLHTLAASLDMLQEDVGTGNKLINTMQWSLEMIQSVLNDVLVLEQMKKQVRIIIQPCKFRLLDITERLVKRFGPGAVRKEIRLDHRVFGHFDESMRVIGDQRKLSQALGNGLSNAIKYTPKGGTIVVEIAVGTPEKMTKSVFCSGEEEDKGLNLPEGPQPGRVSLTDDNTTVVDCVWVTFKVIDTGAGLTADQIDLLMKFEPFTQIAGNATVNEDASGLGLGIAREIVSAHGGNLTMTSPGKGHGCSFVIHMPFQLADCGAMTPSGIDALTEMEGLGLLQGIKGDRIGEKLPTDARRSSVASNAEVPSSPAITNSYRNPASVEKGSPADVIVARSVAAEVLQLPSPEAQRRERRRHLIRILVVDDDDDCRDATKAMLERLKCAEIGTACDGQEAVQQVLGDMSWDMIFMDNLMPRMNGVTATKKIREAGFEAPILALTANVLKSDQDAFLEARANEVLCKGLLNMKLLRTKIDQYLPGMMEECKRNAAADASANVPPEKRTVEAQGGQETEGNKEDAAEEAHLSLLDATAAVRKVQEMLTSMSGRKKSMDRLPKTFAEAYSLYLKDWQLTADNYKLTEELRQRAKRGMKKPWVMFVVGQESKLVRDSIEAIMKELRLDLVTVGSGNEALEYMRMDEPLPVAMLLQYKLPDMYAVECIHKLRLNFMQQILPTVVLASSETQISNEVLESGIKSGASDFFVMPQSERLFKMKLDSMIQTRQMVLSLNFDNASSSDLLEKILPSSVVSRLQEGCTQFADSHEAVTIFFSDISGFTQMTSEIQTEALVQFLNKLLSIMDGLTDEFGVFKVETIGDAYMCASGHDEAPDHAIRMIRFAQAVNRMTSQITMPNDKPLKMRLGIHTGPAFSGVVGMKRPRYCFFGDTVNTAARMEQNGIPGLVHVSQYTKQAVDEYIEKNGRPEGFEDFASFLPRTPRAYKGKGLLETFIAAPDGHEGECRRRLQLEDAKGPSDKKQEDEKKEGEEKEENKAENGQATAAVPHQAPPSPQTDHHPQYRRTRSRARSERIHITLDDQSVGQSPFPPSTPAPPSPFPAHSFSSTEGGMVMKAAFESPSIAGDNVLPPPASAPHKFTMPGSHGEMQGGMMKRPLSARSVGFFSGGAAQFLSPRPVTPSRWGGESAMSKPRGCPSVEDAVAVVDMIAGGGTPAEATALVNFGDTQERLMLVCEHLQLDNVTLKKKCQKKDQKVQELKDQVQQHNVEISRLEEELDDANTKASHLWMALSRYRGTATVTAAHPQMHAQSPGVSQLGGDSEPLARERSLRQN